MSYSDFDPDPAIMMFIGFVLGGIAMFIFYKLVLWKTKNF